MNCDFDTLADKKDIGCMKYIETEESVKKSCGISFEGAEMDFKTAPVIINAVKSLAKRGAFTYTIADKPYIDAILWWLKTQRKYDAESEWIVPTYGTIHSVATAIRLLTAVGEGIIVQPPVYYRYEQAATRLSRKTVYNNLIVKDGQYEIDFDNLEQCMADRNNKIFVLCNPQNPVARVWAEDDLKKIADLAHKYDVVVFSDEIFAEVIFDENKMTSYGSVAKAGDRFIVSTSLGKAFSLTGMNNANLIIPNADFREAFKRQRNADHFGSIDPLVYTSVRAAYSEEGADWIFAMKAYVYENIKLLKNFMIHNFPSVKLYPTQGGYIAWIDWRSLGLSSSRLYDFLTNEACLQMDKGTDYGECGDGFSRISIAAPRSELEKALEKLAQAAEKQKII